MAVLLSLKNKLGLLHYAKSQPFRGKESSLKFSYLSIKISPTNPGRTKYIAFERYGLKSKQKTQGIFYSLQEIFVRSQNTESTTVQSTTDREIYSSTESVSTDVFNSSLETTEEPEKTNQTDIEEEPPCFPNPCHNGTCIPDGEDFQCSCRSGYEGKTCEIHNMCGEDDYCKNGVCKKDSERKTKYCECHSDFYWDENKGKCEAIEHPCLPNPCKNGGTCESVSTEEFNCTCAEGYLGKTCEIQNFCIASETEEDMQCENGVCIDSKLSKICKCNEGYFWDQESHICRGIMEPCLPNPCSNDGKCTPFSTDSFICNCSEGYYGSKCTERDYCSLKGGNTFCGIENCKNEPSLEIYYCTCEKGQYFDYGLRTCLDIDFCPLMECSENEECRDSMCQCKENYERDNSTDDCEPHFCSSNPCPISDLTCTEGDGADSYQCACKNGYAFDGKHCKAGATCLFSDLNACEQICMPEEDGYTCDCEEDFLLNEDNRTCVYIGNFTNCSNKTCNDGTCIRTEEGEKCICRPGYEESEGNCVDLYNIGHLPEGYCPDNKYEATDSGFKCKCEGKYIYSEDGITCKVRKMCDEGEIGWKTCSKRHALCIEDWSTADGFTCQCIEGQIATEGGFCRDICSIEENQRQCSLLGAECEVNAKGEKTCKCPPYFLPFENGKACNKPASYSYLLTLPLNPSSYKENGRSKRSTDIKFADVDYHRVQRDVRKAMEKLFPQLLYSNVLNCRENSDYIKCKVELQFVSITDEDLKKLQLPEMCHASEDIASACLFPPSLILRKEYLKTVMSIQRTNPCEADIKENLCGSETFCTSKPDESIFKCRCEAGFSFRGILFPFGDSESFIENCKDIDECATENPCPDNMDCHNALGSYTCSCKAGYRAKDSLEPETGGCVEICNPNPCVHGDCMTTGDHSFDCKCSPGYNGLFCDLQDENFKRAKTNTIIVGAVLGGCLLVVIILSIANISRLKKKKKMLENDRMLYGTEMTERRGGEAGTVNNAYQRD
ncbi:Matrilin-2 like protein [Argiope bruennichi]|uniref:Matrilin-2 like protein n=1 Tax=Argiope bruennichi TaxID=94029 RepID=A0A8T0EP25_ARGBR|nr:Matrilin-2 like protein [Argiope bruennichi]